MELHLAARRTGPPERAASTFPGQNTERIFRNRCPCAADCDEILTMVHQAAPIKGPPGTTRDSDLRKFVMIKTATCGNAIEAFAEACLNRRSPLPMSNIKILHLAVPRSEELAVRHIREPPSEGRSRTWRTIEPFRTATSGGLRLRHSPSLAQCRRRHQDLTQL